MPRGIKRHLSTSLATLMLVTHSAPLAAVPPPPPAQAGSVISTYDCGQQSLTVSKSWNYKLSPKHRYVVRIGRKTLSRTDAERLDREIERRGPFQAVSVYCIEGAAYELAFHRYTPSKERLQVYLAGNAIRQISLIPFKSLPRSRESRFS